MLRKWLTHDVPTDHKQTGWGPFLRSLLFSPVLPPLHLSIPPPPPIPPKSSLTYAGCTWTPIWGAGLGILEKAEGRGWATVAGVWRWRLRYGLKGKSTSRCKCSSMRDRPDKSQKKQRGGKEFHPTSCPYWGRGGSNQIYACLTKPIASLCSPQSLERVAGSEQRYIA